jgi:hypothetical protein
VIVNLARELGEKVVEVKNVEILRGLYMLLKF